MSSFSHCPARGAACANEEQNATALITHVSIGNNIMLIMFIVRPRYSEMGMCAFAPLCAEMFPIEFEQPKFSSSSALLLPIGFKWRTRRKNLGKGPCRSAFLRDHMIWPQFLRS